MSRSFLWVASVRSHFKPIFRFHHSSMATHACVFRTIYIAGGRSLVGGSVPTFQFTVLCNPCGLLAIVTSRCVRQVAFLLCWGAVIASPLCAFIIAQSSWFVKNFFTKSYIFPRRYLARTSSRWRNVGTFVRGHRQSLSPWHQYIITSDHRLQDGILHKIGIYNLCVFVYSVYWQNCWRYDIMKISRPASVGARPNSSLCTIKKPTAFISRSQKRWGNSIQMLAISGATPIAFS